MSGRAEVEALRRLYGDRGDVRDADIAARRRQLVDLGDCLAAQLAELERDFTRERADRVVQSLAGVVTHVRRLVADAEAR